MNGLVEVQRYTYYVDSSQRSSGTNTNFTINVQKILTLLSKRGRFALVMHRITIPFSFNQLDTAINVLEVRIADSTGNTKTGNLTFTPGNYTAVSILTELQTQLTKFAVVPSGSYVGYTPTYDFQYTTSTGLTTLILKTGYIMELRFSKNTKLGGFFGMTTDQTISTSLFAVSSQIVCTNPVNVLYLRSSSLVQLNNREYIVEKDQISDVVYAVPIATQVGTYIHHVSNSDPFYVINNNISSFTFYLTNNLNYNPISLQNLPWSFKFSMIEYEMPAYEPLIQIISVSNITPKTEIDELKERYEKEIRRLEKYQDLLRRLPFASKEETTPSSSKKPQQPVRVQDE